MKRIYFLRHGHADQDLSDDKRRKLSAEGRKQVESIAAAFHQHNLELPTYALSSSAVRTHQTAELFLLKLGLGEIEIHYRDELYNARAHKIVTAIEDLPDSVDTALYVGHNPGIEEACATLSGDYIALGTANMVSLGFEIDSWKLVGSVSPSDKNYLTPES